MNRESEDDYLEEDPIIPGQRWILMSYFMPNTVKTGPDFNWDITMFKFRGAFETEEKAIKYKEYLETIDSYHQIFIGQAGRWIPWNAQDSSADKVEYADEKYNQMMKSWVGERKRIDAHDNERRVNALKNAEKYKRMMEREKIEADRKKLEQDNNIAKGIVTNIINSYVQGETVPNLSKSNEENKTKVLPMDTNDVNANVVNTVDPVLVKQQNTVDKLQEEIMRVENQLKNLKSKHSKM